MKTKNLLTTALFVAIAAIANATPVEGWEIVHSRKKETFAFNTGRDMKGAELKVLYSNGDVLVSERMRRRRMVIDFAEVKKGTYTILLMKNGMTKTFQYEKR